MSAVPQQKDALRFVALKGLEGNAREQLKGADAKAGLVLTALGTLVAGLAVMVALSKPSGISQVFIGLAALAILATLFCVLVTVWARLPKGIKTRAWLEKQVEIAAQQDESAYEQEFDRTCQLHRIWWIKSWGINVGLCTLGLAAVFMLCAIFTFRL